MAKNDDDIATIAYMKGFEDGRDAEAKEAASRIEHWMKLEAKAMAEIDDLRAQLECAKSDVAELRQQRAVAESRIKELEEERQPIADVIAGLLNVYLSYEDSIDPDHETVEAINRGKAALEALRKDLDTDVPPSSTGVKC